MRNHLNKKRFDLHENGREGGRHFHMNGFARRFVFNQRQKVTRSVCSAPGIETSFRLQHLKSAIGHVLNEQGTGYEHIFSWYEHSLSIELKMAHVI